MIKQIGINDPILQSESFLKDIDKYQIMIKNFTNPLLQLYSDSENYIICRGEEQYPAWIWTQDNLDVSFLPEIEEAIRMFILDEVKTNFTCKEELYNLLLKDNFSEINLEDKFKMGFLKCKQTNDLENNNVKFDRPNEDDKKIIAENIFKFNDAMDDNVKTKNFTMEMAATKADEFIREDTSYVLRNEEGKIVSMAHYLVSGKYGKIGEVYTDDNERGKGYAAFLIKKISDIILEKQLIPSLYTDYNYPVSNKAYIKAGFVSEGYLINFTCSKKKTNIFKL